MRNPFTPVGTADLAHLTFLAAVAAHMGTDDDLRALLDTVTTHAARIIRLEGYGVAPGCRADLVLWDCERAEDVAMALPPRLLAVRRGRVSVEMERHVRSRWREVIR